MDHDEEKDFIRSFTNFKYKPLYNLLCKQIEKENIRLTLTEKFLVFASFYKTYYEHISSINKSTEREIIFSNFPIIFSVAENIQIFYKKLYKNYFREVYFIESKYFKNIQKILKSNNVKFNYFDYQDQYDNRLTIIYFDIEKENAVFITDLFRKYVSKFNNFTIIYSLDTSIIYKKQKIYWIPAITPVNGIINLDLNKRIAEYNHSFREDLNNIYRSSWEANFARILKYFNIDFKYEELILKLNESWYIPDFIIKDTIVEIKGFWDRRSLDKLLQFTRLYSSYKLLLLDADIYYFLDKYFSDKIIFWEKNKLCLHSTIINIDKMDLSLNLQTNEKLFFKIYNKKDVILENCTGEKVGKLTAEWSLVYQNKINLGLSFSITILSIEDLTFKIKIKPETKHHFDYNKFIKVIKGGL